MIPKAFDLTSEETPRIVIQIPSSVITPQFLQKALDAAIPTPAAPQKGKGKGVLTGEETQPIISPMKSLQQIEEENLRALKEGIKASREQQVGHSGAGPSEVAPTPPPVQETITQQPQKETIYTPPPSDFPVSRWNMFAKVSDDHFRPRQTFDLPSDNEQLDLPLSPNAPFYEIFPPMDPHAPLADQIAHERRRLTDTNRHHAKPEHVVWSRSRIRSIPRYSTKTVTKQSLGKVKTKEYLPVLEIERMDNTKETVSGADFPLMNPSDIVTFINHFHDKVDRDHRAKLAFDFSYRFMDYYLTEMGRLDAEMYEHFSTFTVPSNPDTTFDGINSRASGPTDDPELGIIFTTKGKLDKGFFRASQKHKFSNAVIERLMKKIPKYDAPEHLKDELIRQCLWIIEVRSWMLMVKLFMDELKRDHPK